MKEKDLDKCLDNLIIKGLIQEAEQDNADFEFAMRNMSDEDFLGLIYDSTETPIAANRKVTGKIHSRMSSSMVNPKSPILLENANRVFYESAEMDEPASLSNSKTRIPAQKGWKPWAAAIASVAAILLIVFIPANREMDSRLCESALLVSEAYMAQSRGSDISSMEKEEVKTMLPELEKQYSISINKAKGIAVEDTREKDDTAYYLENLSLQETGMELVQAYLKLNQKGEAIETLRELAEADDDPDFAEYCRKMLEILE